MDPCSQQEKIYLIKKYTDVNTCKIIKLIFCTKYKIQFIRLVNLQHINELFSSDIIFTNQKHINIKLIFMTPIFNKEAGSYLALNVSRLTLLPRNLLSSYYLLPSKNLIMPGRLRLLEFSSNLISK